MDESLLVSQDTRNYLLDETGYLSGVCDIKFIQCLPSQTESILLHGLQHIGLSDDCLAFQHSWVFAL